MKIRSLTSAPMPILTYLSHGLLFSLFFMTCSAAWAAETPVPRDCRYLMMGETEIREALRALNKESEKAEKMSPAQVYSLITDLRAAANVLLGLVDNGSDREILQAFTTARRLEKQTPPPLENQFTFQISPNPVVTRFTRKMGSYGQDLTSIGARAYEIHEIGEGRRLVGYVTIFDVAVKPILNAEFARHFHQKVFSHFKLPVRIEKQVQAPAARLFTNQPLARELGLFEAAFIAPVESFGLYVEALPFMTGEDDKEMDYSDFLDWLEDGLDNPALFLISDVFDLGVMPRPPKARSRP